MTDRHGGKMAEGIGGYQKKTDFCSSYVPEGVFHKKTPIRKVYKFYAQRTVNMPPGLEVFSSTGKFDKWR